MYRKGCSHRKPVTGSGELVRGVSYVRELVKKGAPMRNINAVLDTAKKVHKIGSDYKLAMYLGVGDSNLRNYRHGRSLPDAKVCSKLAAALGEKPDLLIVEMQAQREKDAETRALWESLAKRLQKGVAGIKMMLLLAIVSIAFYAVPALAGVYVAASATQAAKIYIVEYLSRLIRGLANFVKNCKVTAHVPCKPLAQPAATS